MEKTGLSTLIKLASEFNTDFEKVENEKITKRDKIVEDLKREFDIRSCVGITKYKTTLQDNCTDDFLQHLKEELMDACLYIQKLQSK